MFTIQKNETIEYYLLNETLVDEETNAKHHRIISENVVTDNLGRRILTLTFRQVLQSANVRNWNGRIYGDQDITRSIQSNPLIQHDLKMGTWGGEYGHPIIEKGMNELARQMTLWPPAVCWIVKNPHMEGNLLIGECTTTAGGYGDMVRDRILSGVPAMASSRAIGGVDKNGRVLPGYTLCYIDCVFRPSHKEAYMEQGSVKVNNFNVPSGNTMSESAIKIDVLNDTGFKNFLLSESVSRDKISMVCDTLKLDYDSMVISENALKITRIDGTNKQTIVMPLNKLVGAEYWRLF